MKQSAFTAENAEIMFYNGRDLRKHIVTRYNGFSERVHPRQGFRDDKNQQHENGRGKPRVIICEKSFYSVFIHYAVHI